MMPALTDDSLFPFGKYKGVRLADVPAHYLDWLRDQEWLNKWPDVRRYIELNENAIDEELQGGDR